MAGLAIEHGEARGKGETKRGLTAGSRTSSESSGTSDGDVRAVEIYDGRR